jgi:hypothetical protein
MIYSGTTKMVFKNSTITTVNPDWDDWCYGKLRISTFLHPLERIRSFLGPFCVQVAVHMKSSACLSWESNFYGEMYIDDQQNTQKGCSLGFFGSIESFVHRHNPDFPWVFSFRVNGTGLLTIVTTL